METLHLTYAKFLKNEFLEKRVERLNRFCAEIKEARGWMIKNGLEWESGWGPFEPPGMYTLFGKEGDWETESEEVTLGPGWTEHDVDISFLVY